MPAFHPQARVKALEHVPYLVLPTETKVVSQTPQDLQPGREIGDNIVFDYCFHESFLYKIFPRYNGNPPGRNSKAISVLFRVIPDLGMGGDLYAFTNNGLLDPGVATYNHVF